MSQFANKSELIFKNPVKRYGKYEVICLPQKFADNYSNLFPEFRAFRHGCPQRFVGAPSCRTSG